MAEEINKYLEEIERFENGSKEELEKFRIKFLGSKGLIKTLFGKIKEIPPGERKAFGQEINELKNTAEARYQSLKEKLEERAGEFSTDDLDLTLPPEPIEFGARHPLTIIRNQITDIFRRLGYNISTGPEIEDDWHNFTALNMPEDHPARDMQDTFFLSTNPAMVLRTHTSSVQVRVMETTKPPIRTISPGRVFRNETISARAHCIFHQVEGLNIDEDISFADMKQTLYFFVQEMFGQDTQIRFRPSYFPFTEPSAEVDVSCFICGGEGCNICKHSGWVEIMGCGMVDPAVLDNCNIDSEKYTGFAFGMGIERIAMLKYQITDIRLFFENDLRFLRQFKSAF